MEKKLLEGKVITLPITPAYVKLCDEQGHVITDESKLPLVYNHEKGVFRILGWSSKMGQILHLKNVNTGEELPYAPISELKKLSFEYYNPANGNYDQLPIITEVDYSFLFMEKGIVDVSEKHNVRFYQMYYEIDNTEEARKQFNDGESQIESSIKVIYYAKLSYTPDEEWDNVIVEAHKHLMKNVQPITAYEIEKAFCKNIIWNYIKENYYPPTKRK